MEKLKNQLKLNNMKDLKIEVPEGYEIDKEKSTFERIVFKKRDGRVRKWEDLVKISGFIIDTKSEFIELKDEYSEDRNKGIYPTKQDAESALALAQLLQFRQQWLNDYDPNWKPVLDGSNGSWCIYRERSYFKTGKWSITYHELSFPTKEMAEDFSKTFEDLLKVYFKIK